MAIHTAKLKEYNDRAQALYTWFESQGIEPREAIVTMAYLTGIICAERAKDMQDLEYGLGLSNNLSKVIAMGAMVAKGS